MAPGPVLLPESYGVEERDNAAERTALRRVGSATDVAAAVLYLDGAEFVTGEVMYVDGGARLV